LLLLLYVATMVGCHSRPTPATPLPSASVAQLPGQLSAPVFWEGLVIRNDTVWKRALRINSRSKAGYDTAYLYPNNRLPLNYQEAMTYGIAMTSVKAITKWSRAHGIKSFVLQDSTAGVPFIYYRYVSKKEEFKIFNLLQLEEETWVSGKPGEEGWVKIFCDQGFWYKGNLYTGDPRGAYYGGDVAPELDPFKK